MKVGVVFVYRVHFNATKVIEETQLTKTLIIEFYLSTTSKGVNVSITLLSKPNKLR